MASLCHITKEKKLSKNSTKSAIWKRVPGPFMFAKNQAQPLLENEIFESYLYRYVLAKLSKFFQISTLTSSDSFLQRIV